MTTRSALRGPARLLTALVVVVALFAPSCGDDQQAEEPTPTPTEQPTPTPTDGPTPSPTEEPTATPTGQPTPPPVQPHVLVYFLSGEQLVVGGRQTQTEAVAADAMVALLAGPVGLENDLGWTSAIPDGTTLHGIVIEEGTATVDLSPEFESGGGSLSVTSRVAQVVFTLTQFPMVDEVDIEIDGVAAEAIAGEGFPGQDLSRDDFLVPDFAGSPAPLILVESPFTGETPEAPELVIAGLSNTFEANVQFEVTDTDGVIVHEGFTTATAGTGTWGTFEVVLDLGDEIPAFDREGMASVFVFELSPRDGERINVVEVPIVVGPDWVATS